MRHLWGGDKASMTHLIREVFSRYKGCLAYDWNIFVAVVHDIVKVDKHCYYIWKL